MPIVRKSKLLIVDLAGSERIDKSGLLLFHSHLPVLFDFLFDVFTHKLFLGGRDIVVMWYGSMQCMFMCLLLFFGSCSRLINNHI